MQYERENSSFNILDELLNKIKTLENSNSGIKSKISEIKHKLECTGRDETEFELESEFENVEMKIDDQNSNDFLFEKVLNHSITFIPYEQYNVLWVMGDFTNWEPKEMIKNKDMFIFPILLIKGFKYYFTFTAKDQSGIVDYSQDHEINPRNNQPNNFFDAKDSDLSGNNNTNPPFDYNLHANLLNIVKVNYTKSKMREKNENELEIIENFIKFSERFQVRENYLLNKKTDLVEKITKYYDRRIECIKNSETNNFKTLGDIFKRRVIEIKDNFNEKINFNINSVNSSGGTLYLINEIDLKENCLRCIRLYDNNRVKVNIDYYIKKGFFIPFNFQDFNINNYKIYSQEESEKTLEDHKNNTENILKIQFKYQLQDDIQPEGYVYIKTYGNKLLIEKIIPENLEINDYDIDITANMINDVKNKNNNLKVIYITEEIKDPIDSLPISLQVYYSINQKNVNIVHLHSLDEKVNLNEAHEIIMLDKNKNTDDYKEFKSGDTEFVNLRLIFKNFKLFKIFHFSDGTVREIKGEEFNLKSERIVQLDNSSYAKIKSTKPDNLNLTQISNDIEMCPYMLAGYIEVAVIFDQNEKYQDLPLNIIIPACKVIFLPIDQEMNLERKYVTETKKRQSEEIITLENLSNDVSNNYEKYLNNPESLSLITKEELLKKVNSLIEYQNLLVKIGQYIEQNELWSYLEV